MPDDKILRGVTTYNQVKIFVGEGVDEINEWLKDNNVCLLDIKRNLIVDYYTSNGNICNQFMETVIVYSVDE